MEESIPEHPRASPSKGPQQPPKASTDPLYLSNQIFCNSAYPGPMRENLRSPTPRSMPSCSRRSVLPRNALAHPTWKPPPAKLNKLFTVRPSGFWTKRPLQKRNETGTVWVYPFSLLVSPFGKQAVATANESLHRAQYNTTRWLVYTTRWPVASVVVLCPLQRLVGSFQRL